MEPIQLRSLAGLSLKLHPAASTGDAHRGRPQSHRRSTWHRGTHVLGTGTGIGQTPSRAPTLSQVPIRHPDILIFARRSRLIALPYDIEAGDSGEVARVGGDDAPPKTYSGGGDEAIVGADVSAGGHKFGPDAGVDACRT